MTPMALSSATFQSCWQVQPADGGNCELADDATVSAPAFPPVASRVYPPRKQAGGQEPSARSLCRALPAGEHPNSDSDEGERELQRHLRFDPKAQQATDVTFL